MPPRLRWGCLANSGRPGLSAVRHRTDHVVSSVKSYGEGSVMIWVLEDYRDDVVLVVRAQHFWLSDPAG
jgi:hypothetical protein